MRAAHPILRVGACLVLCAVKGLGQPSPQQQDSSLVAVMQEIQIKARQQASVNPDAFKMEASKIADQHLTRILAAGSSQVPADRALAASLLAIASPTNAGTDRLVTLANDGVADVRYAALLALATVTDGTNGRANDVIVQALAESGNHGLTRDAAYAASTLKIVEALPLLERLLANDDLLNKRFAADAASRYGVAAASLLPVLKQQAIIAEDAGLKALLEKALVAVDRPADTHPATPPTRLTSQQAKAVVPPPSNALDKENPGKQPREVSDDPKSGWTIKFGVGALLALLAVALWMKRRHSKSF